MIFGLAVSSGVQAQDFSYSYQGKTFSKNELSPALQQTIFEMQSEYNERLKAVAEAAILEQHVDEEAKKRSKSRQQVEEDLFKVKDPSESDIKSWYEKNKARIPYPFEQIKGQLGQVVAQEKMQEKRTKLVDELKKKGKFSMNLPTLVAPKLEINIQGAPVRGKADAQVVLVEFADYKCPHCKEAAATLEKLFPKYKDKVKFVFMDFPIHKGVAEDLARGSFCAGEQGKYWEFNKMAFERQDKTKDGSSAEFSKELKLDEGKFKECMGSKRPQDWVTKASEEGRRIGVSGTPALFLNGQKLAPPTEKDIVAALDKALK